MSRLSREKMRESEIGETDVGGEIIDMSPLHFLAGNHFTGCIQEGENSGTQKFAAYVRHSLNLKPAVTAFRIHGSTSGSR